MGLSPLCGPGLLLVLVLAPAEGFSPGSPVFLPPEKFILANSHALRTSLSRLRVEKFDLTAAHAFFSHA